MAVAAVAVAVTAVVVLYLTVTQVPCRLINTTIQKKVEVLKHPALFALVKVSKFAKTLRLEKSSYKSVVVCLELNIVAPHNNGLAPNDGHFLVTIIYKYRKDKYRK